jgi:uncharacterized protein (UPF0548 family)
MYLFRRPTDDFVREYLARQADEPWPYRFVGLTRDWPGDQDLPADCQEYSSPQTPDPVRGWCVDRRRVLLGQGQATFAAAKRAIAAWKMFPQEMATLYWPAEPPAPGRIVAVRFWVTPLFVWILIPAKVVYVIDEPRRFGFAYGTLPDHIERGEERFSVEWREDDSVWYDLSVIALPGQWLAWIGYYYVRLQQWRFQRLSCAAMQRATGVTQ